jgi:hypothetical protein
VIEGGFDAESRCLVAALAAGKRAKGGLLSLRDGGHLGTRRDAVMVERWVTSVEKAVVQQRDRGE